MRPPRFALLLASASLLVACGSKGEGEGTTAASSSTTTDSSTTDASATASDTSPSTTSASSSSSTSTTGMSTSSTTTTDGTTTTGSFVEMPDGGDTNECDPKSQDCMDGEKCTAWANDGGGFWNENKCVSVTGNGVAGDPCTVEGGGVSGLDDCDVGFICLNTDENNLGTCVGFCTGADSDCDPGFICAIYNDGVLPICLDECHPLLQDCPNAQSCIDTPNGTFICFTDASGAGGADGDPCPPADGENSCDPGMWCGAGSSGCMDPKCCTPYCDVTGPDTCTSPDQCVSFYSDPNAAPPQYQDVGVCVVP